MSPGASEGRGRWYLSGASFQPELAGSARFMLMEAMSEPFGMELDTPSGWELRRQVGAGRSLRASAACFGRAAAAGAPASAGE